MAQDVFISYASANETLAERVKTDLEGDGITCWFADSSMQAASDFATVIPDAIASSKLLLLLLCSASAASDHVVREVHLADRKKIPILPVRLEPLEPTGALSYFLSNLQYIDAFPRVEPHLARIRHEVYRLLEQQGVKIVGRPISTFRQTLASVAAWLLVLGLTALVLIWIRGMWFNFVPFRRLVTLAAAPWILFACAAVPLLALASQFWSHRRLSRVPTLDALFGLSGSARHRLVGAGGLYAGVALAIAFTPPSIFIRLEQGNLADLRSPHVTMKGLDCRESGSYKLQPMTHYAVYARVDGGYPAGAFELAIELAPYATDDGVEFCEVKVDPRFPGGSTQLTPQGVVRVVGDLAQPLLSPILVFSLKHYRDSVPSNDAAVTATLTPDGSSSAAYHELLPKSIWSAN